MSTVLPPRRGGSGPRLACVFSWMASLRSGPRYGWRSSIPRTERRPGRLAVGPSGVGSFAWRVALLCVLAMSVHEALDGFRRQLERDLRVGLGLGDGGGQCCRRRVKGVKRLPDALGGGAADPAAAGPGGVA